MSAGGDTKSSAEPTQMRFLVGFVVLLSLLSGCQKIDTRKSLETKSPEPAPSPKISMPPALVWFNLRELPLEPAELERQLGGKISLETISDTKSIISWDGWRFTHIVGEGSYFRDESELDSRFEVETQRELVRLHSNWTSIEVLEAPQGLLVRDGYPPLGKVCAALSNDDCLLLYNPELGLLQNYDSQTLNALRKGDPFSAFGFFRHPMMMVYDHDSEMAAAMNHARETWPEFLEHMENPGEKRFAVSNYFVEGKKGEYLWVNIAHWEGEKLRGQVVNVPVTVKGVKVGDEVLIDPSKISDWAVFDGGKMIGGFTEEVKRRRREAELDRK